MGGEAFAGDAPQRIEIARLGADEFPREAELAVDHAEPGFQCRRLGGERAGGIAEAHGLAPAGAQRDQPADRDQQDRQGPAADEGDAFAGRYPGGEAVAQGPAEERGPQGHRGQREGRHQPLARGGGVVLRCRFKGGVRFVGGGRNRAGGAGIGQIGPGGGQFASGSERDDA